MTDRIIAIGDVHGCAEALATLLAAIQPTGVQMRVQINRLSGTRIHLRYFRKPLVDKT
jgi:hypothetical protein